MLALRVWASAGAYGFINTLQAGFFGRVGRTRRSDFRLNRSARKLKSPQIIWEDDEPVEVSDTDEDDPDKPSTVTPLQAAE